MQTQNYTHSDRITLFALVVMMSVCVRACECGYVVEVSSPFTKIISHYGNWTIFSYMVRVSDLLEFHNK